MKEREETIAAIPIEPIHSENEIVLKDEFKIDQILGNTPNWLMRWGITVVSLTTGLFLLISWMLKYPDILSARVVVTTENPAIPVVARNSGNIKKLFVEDKQYVESGTIIASLENTAVWEDVQRLEAMLDSLNHRSESYLLTENFSQRLELGDLQILFTDLQQKIKDYKYFKAQSITALRVQALGNQITQIDQLNQSIIRQKEILDRETKIAHKNYLRHKSLTEDAMSSEMELENIETVYLQYKRQLEMIESQIINNNIQMSQLNTQIHDQSKNRIDEETQKLLSIQKIVQQLRTEIQFWNRQYLIEAPIAGLVALSDIWSDKQPVEQNQEIFKIVPQRNSSKMIGKAILETKGVGKVMLGMAANIRLDQYPYKEYGTIPATINSISLVPKDNQYLIELTLADSLKTSYRKTIPYKPEMQGVAQIITKEKRLLERVFERILSIIR